MSRYEICKNTNQLWDTKLQKYVEDKKGMQCKHEDKYYSPRQLLYFLYFGKECKFTLYKKDINKPLTIKNLQTLPIFKERNRNRKLPKNVYLKRDGRYEVIMKFDKLYEIGNFKELEDAELAVTYCKLLGKPIKMSGKNLGTNLQKNTGKLWE